MRDVSLLHERSPVAIEPARDGGYNVTFEECGHTALVYVLPFVTSTYYCPECFDLFIETMNAERCTLGQ